MRRLTISWQLVLATACFCIPLFQRDAALAHAPGWVRMVALSLAGALALGIAFRVPFIRQIVLGYPIVALVCAAVFLALASRLSAHFQLGLEFLSLFLFTVPAAILLHTPEGTQALNRRWRSTRSA